MPVSSESSSTVRGARTSSPSMSTIFDRLGAILVTWYPHFAWHTFQFPRASPHLTLMRRICAAAAGCALRKIRPEATGYVGGEGHRKAPMQRAASRTAPVNPSATSAMIVSAARSENPVKSPWRIILRVMSSPPAPWHTPRASPDSCCAMPVWPWPTLFSCGRVGCSSDMFGP
jgi:hypothetical protein